MTTLWRFALAAALLYAGVVAALALTQTALIFPRWAMSGAESRLPSDTRRLQVDRPGGVTLHGMDLPGPRDDLPVILGFGGNAWPADALANYLRAALPDHRIVVFHYRGYGPSSGRPSARALAEDALAIHDHLQARNVVAVGLSLGSGPAAHLAARRDLAGLVLVTPFDSLTNLAQGHYPWAPVRLLLRHRMEVARDLEGVQAPVALIAAGSDTIIPAQRTAPLREVASNLVLDRTIPGAGHNTLYEHPDFVPTLRAAVARMIPP